MSSDKFTSIALNIQNVRENADLLSKEAAYKVGVSRSLWSLYESGERTPSLNKMIKIARVFDVSMDELVGLKPLKLKRKK